MTVYTFWEPREKIPYYLRLCMKTWEKFLPNAEIVVLDYKNLRDYIDVDELGEVLFSGRFTLPQIADAIRVVLLAKHGGVWMDVDTVILSSDAEKYFLPDEQKRTFFFGTPASRNLRICFINTPPAAECMTAWLEFIKKRLQTLTSSTKITWDFLGNKFINSYAREHVEEIEIFDMNPMMPHLKIISKETGITYRSSDDHYYFLQNHHLVDVDCDMLLLHNSWTPKIYKNFSPEEFLLCDCTMTNVLAEALDITLPPPMSVSGSKSKMGNGLRCPILRRRKLNSRTKFKTPSEMLRRAFSFGKRARLCYTCRDYR